MRKRKCGNEGFSRRSPLTGPLFSGGTVRKVSDPSRVTFSRFSFCSSECRPGEMGGFGLFSIENLAERRENCPHLSRRAILSTKVTDTFDYLLHQIRHWQFIAMILFDFYELKNEEDVEQIPPTWKNRIREDEDISS